jgi:hypothetical protein
MGNGVESGADFPLKRPDFRGIGRKGLSIIDNKGGLIILEATFPDG